MGFSKLILTDLLSFIICNIRYQLIEKVVLLTEKTIRCLQSECEEIAESTNFCCVRKVFHLALLYVNDSLTSKSFY